MFRNVLTDAQIGNFINKRTDGKSARLSDGMGLWLNVTTKQTKQFRFDYSRPNTKSENFPNGKRNTISIGKYPSLSLLEARKKRDEYKLYLLKGSTHLNGRNQKREKIFLKRAVMFHLKR